MTITNISQSEKEYINKLFSDNQNIDLAELKSNVGIRIRTHGSLVARERVYETYFAKVPPRDVAIWAMWIFGYKWKDICSVFSVTRRVATEIVKQLQARIPSE